MEAPLPLVEAARLLDLVKAIAENEKLVRDLDKEVGKGAAPGIVEATPLGTNMKRSSKKGRLQSPQLRSLTRCRKNPST